MKPLSGVNLKGTNMPEGSGMQVDTALVRELAELLDSSHLTRHGGHERAWRQQIWRILGRRFRHDVTLG